MCSGGPVTLKKPQKIIRLLIAVRRVSSDKVSSKATSQRRVLDFKVLHEINSRQQDKDKVLCFISYCTVILLAVSLLNHHLSVK